MAIVPVPLFGFCFSGFVLLRIGFRGLAFKIWVLGSRVQVHRVCTQGVVMAFYRALGSMPNVKNPVPKPLSPKPSDLKL